MKQYLDMCRYVLENGEERKDRTGTGTLGVFGYQNRYDLSEGFPLMTTKKMPARVIFEELKWFLDGSTELTDLLDKDVNIWNADAYRWYKQKYPETTLGLEGYIKAVKDGMLKKECSNLGPIYGKQWKSWYDVKRDKEIDQIANVIKSIKEDPYGRRHIVSAWNVSELEDMSLPPCHLLFQFYVSAEGKLSCQLYQRSADMFLGVPFNIASYAFLIHMVAHVTGLKVGEFVHTFGDLHLYKNHIDQVKTQLTREPKKLPELKIKRKVKDINEFKWEDFEIVGYDPYPTIKGKVSVG